MSDENRSGDEILELTDAMTDPHNAAADTQIPSPQPLPPRSSVPPTPFPVALPPAVAHPALQAAQQIVGAQEQAQHSGVKTTPIRRISTMPLAPATTGTPSIPPTPAPASDEAVTRPSIEPSGVRGGLEDAVMDLGADMVIAHPPEEPSLLSMPSPSINPPPPSPTTTLPLASSSVATPSEPPIFSAPSIPPPTSTDVPDRDATPAEEEEEEEEEGVEVTVDVESDSSPAPEDSLLQPRTARSEEDELELDLAEAEEMTAKRRTAPPPLPTPGAVLARPVRMRRKRGDKEWWAEIFDDDFLALLPEPHPREERREVDFVERALNVPTSSLILDLGCGNGRATVGMARRGYRMVGVDLSLPMLARAGEAAQEADQKINFIHGDIRDLGFDKNFDAVFCIGTSFGYFDEATNIKVIEGVARALKPGGNFLLEVANRDFALTRQPNLSWFEGIGSVCMEETEFNYTTSRLKVTRQVIFNSDNRQSRYELSLRLYSLHELIDMLQKVGFTISRVDGHMATPSAFFGIDSAQIAVIAKKNP
ncbi:MAG: methyltransferase domain-containing protein [Myxococcota bacterium]|jgi:SAM-dependent methyltransferase|nr:methyltransferase domain-containing protein [Myxococcota bacterium]